MLAKFIIFGLYFNGKQRNAKFVLGILNYLCLDRMVLKTATRMRILSAALLKGNQARNSRMICRRRKPLALKLLLDQGR